MDRVGRTCISCRVSKVKCNKENPCSRCLRLHTTCIAQTRGRGRPVQDIKSPEVKGLFGASSCRTQASRIRRERRSTPRSRHKIAFKDRTRRRSERQRVEKAPVVQEMRVSIAESCSRDAIPPPKCTIEAQEVSSNGGSRTCVLDESDSWGELDHMLLRETLPILPTQVPEAPLLGQASVEYTLGSTNDSNLHSGIPTRSSMDHSALLASMEVLSPPLSAESNRLVVSGRSQFWNNSLYENWFHSSDECNTLQGGTLNNSQDVWSMIVHPRERQEFTVFFQALVNKVLQVAGHTAEASVVHHCVDRCGKVFLGLLRFKSLLLGCGHAFFIMSVQSLPASKYVVRDLNLGEVPAKFSHSPPPCTSEHLSQNWQVPSTQGSVKGNYIRTRDGESNIQDGLSLDHGCYLLSSPCTATGSPGVAAMPIAPTDTFQGIEMRETSFDSSLSEEDLQAILAG